MFISQRIPISDKNFHFRLNFRQKLILLTGDAFRTTIACNSRPRSKIWASSSSASQISGSDS